MIEVKGLSKSFGSKRVLDKVDLSFATGKIHFIIGRSGTGKSVLLKSLVGLLTPEEGEIWIGGKRVDGRGEEEWGEVRRHCGMVFQSPALLDSLTIRENVAFGLRAHSLTATPAEEESRVKELLSWVGVPLDCLGKLPTELGFSLQKRVSIARTLAPSPNHLLFDEPTTGLDPVTTTRINHLIERLARQLNLTVVVVSHDMHCALAIADQIVMLDQAKVIASGSPKELEKSTSQVVREFLREAIARRSA